MKAWAISDSHGMHGEYMIPSDVDIVIHGGDSTNYFDIIRNETEFRSFISWLERLPIKHKIIIPGNHDTWATKRYNVQDVRDRGIHLLIHEHLELEGIKFFGSPYTPTFANWNFMVPRHKLSKYWEAVDDDVDVLLTHGPAKGILDLSHDIDHKLEFCGDLSLLKLFNRISPQYHIFGHIHSSDGCINSGVFKPSDMLTTFINASSVTDGKFGNGLSSHGQVIIINQNNKN